MNITSISGQVNMAKNVAAQIIGAIEGLGGYAYKDPINADDGFLALIVSERAMTEDEVHEFAEFNSEDLGMGASAEDEALVFDFLDACIALEDETGEPADWGFYAYVSYMDDIYPEERIVSDEDFDAISKDFKVEMELNKTANLNESVSLKESEELIADLDDDEDEAFVGWVMTNANVVEPSDSYYQMYKDYLEDNGEAPLIVEEQMFYAAVKEYNSFNEPDYDSPASNNVSNPPMDISYDQQIADGMEDDEDEAFIDWVMTLGNSPTASDQYYEMYKDYLEGNGESPLIIAQNVFDAAVEVYNSFDE